MNQVVLLTKWVSCSVLFLVCCCGDASKSMANPGDSTSAGEASEATRHESTDVTPTLDATVVQALAALRREVGAGQVPTAGQLERAGASMGQWRECTALVEELEQPVTAEMRRAWAFEPEQRRRNRQVVREWTENDGSAEGASPPKVAPSEVASSLDALQSGDLLVRRRGARAIADVADGSHLPILVALLADQDSAILISALKGLTKLGIAAGPAADEVSAVLVGGGPDGANPARVQRIRSAAAAALAGMGGSGHSRLLAALESEEPAVLVPVLEALVGIGVTLEGSTARLAKLAGHEEVGVCAAALRLLAETPGAVPAAREAIVAALGSDDEQVASAGRALLPYLPEADVGQHVAGLVDALFSGPQQRSDRRMRSMIGPDPKLLESLATIGEPALAALARRQQTGAEANTLVVAVSAIAASHPELAETATAIFREVAPRLGKGDMAAVVSILNTVTQPDFRSGKKAALLDAMVDNDRALESMAGPMAMNMLAGGQQLSEMLGAAMPRLRLGSDAELMVPTLADRVVTGDEKIVTSLLMIATSIGMPAIDVHRAVLQRAAGDQKMAMTVLTTLTMARQSNLELTEALQPDVERVMARHPQLRMLVNMMKGAQSHEGK